VNSKPIAFLLASMRKNDFLNIPMARSVIQLLVNLFYISLFLFSGFYIAYYLICYFYRSKRAEKDGILSYEKMELPTVSFIIPVFNENKVIRKKMANLRDLIYPRNKLEVIFVDGGSTDGTDKAIKDDGNCCDFSVKFIQQGKRLGFNRAVIDGFKSSTGEVIFITGADTTYAPDVLKRIIPYFSNGRIGAVNGRQIIQNLDEGLSPKHEHAYRTMLNFVKEGENNMDTQFDVQGEIVAARRIICQQLVSNPEFRHKGCIDFCFFLQSRADGYLSVFEPNAVYYEISPRSFRESFKQRYRRAATLIQNMLIFKDMIFNRKYGLFGMLIMPAHFFMLIILPYLFLTGLISFLILNIAYFPNLYLIALAFGALLLLFSKTFQAFCQLQMVLITSHVKMLKGVETQRFEKLESARP
jgi:biofilm PGA synthesis N-glycosyltransferase PgaC